jgi:hypothetical protein
VDGIDLSALWREEGAAAEAAGGAPGSRALFAEADLWMGMEEGNRRRAVRRGRHVLHWDALSGEAALYDVSADPGEQRDVAAREPQVVEELLAALAPFLRDSALDADSLEIDPRMREELRALGYVE